MRYMLLMHAPPGTVEYENSAWDPAIEVRQVMRAPAADT